MKPNSTRQPRSAPYLQPLHAVAIGPLSWSYDVGPIVSKLELHKGEVRHHARENPAFAPDSLRTCSVYRHVCIASNHARNSQEPFASFESHHAIDARYVKGEAPCLEEWSRLSYDSPACSPLAPAPRGTGDEAYHSHFQHAPCAKTATVFRFHESRETTPYHKLPAAAFRCFCFTILLRSQENKGAVCMNDTTFFVARKHKFGMILFLHGILSNKNISQFHFSRYI